MTTGESLAGQTVETARRILAARLRNHAIDSAELDARMLIGAVLGLDLTGMIAAANRLLTVAEALRLADFTRRRIEGEPVARILRAAPEPNHRLRVADIGTGSGAILLALLSELPGACGVGTDISEAALRTASANAANLRLADRAGFVACDYAAALSDRFDLIVSNPPYIRSAEIAGLDAEVRDHDPRAALDGGADGLEAYRALIPQAGLLLAPFGVLVVEAGHDQSSDIEGLMAAAGLTLERPARADLAGILRAVGGRKLPP